MRHIKHITVAKASAEKIDPAGSVFLQIWAVVMTTILMGAFGMKG
ncbi:MAG: hypothetical protein NTU83_06915 [Candidatus Hydrogenedentes bacterium]|nr:hypothetical protein [Candidatus Hydrogenedentota bacterium]